MCPRAAAPRFSLLRFTTRRPSSTSSSWRSQDELPRARRERAARLGRRSDRPAADVIGKRSARGEPSRSSSPPISRPRRQVGAPIRRSRRRSARTRRAPAIRRWPSRSPPRGAFTFVEASRRRGGASRPARGRTPEAVAHAARRARTCSRAARWNGASARSRGVTLDGARRRRARSVSAGRVLGERASSSCTRRCRPTRRRSAVQRFARSLSWAVEVAVEHVALALADESVDVQVAAGRRSVCCAIERAARGRSMRCCSPSSRDSPAVQRSPPRARSATMAEGRAVETLRELLRDGAPGVAVAALRRSVRWTIRLSATCWSKRSATGTRRSSSRR